MRIFSTLPRRRKLGCLLLCLLSPLLGAASVHLLQAGAEPVLAPHAGPLPVMPDTLEALRAGEDLDGDGLDDGLEGALARHHAPCYRFNAADPAAGSGAQSRDEEFFPGSVAAFLTSLELGVWQVDGETLSGAPGVFALDQPRLLGYPSGLSGQPLGTAPVYTHVYPVGLDRAVCEYWIFYPYDRADARLLGVSVPWGDHRGDWEHTAFRVRLEPPEIEHGYYYGHARCLLVPGQDLELVDGSHPVVYVSQGKHASYPRACQLATTGLPGFLLAHDDVANGRGPSWQSWQGPLIDLGERDAPRAGAARWLAFAGRWGPDGFQLGGLDIGLSPTGPAAKRSWGNHGPGQPWREAVEARGRLFDGAALD